MTKEEIRALRKRLGWTYDQMAKHLGSKNRCTVHHWESGKNSPDRYFQMKLNELYELKARDLI